MRSFAKAVMLLSIAVLALNGCGKDEQPAPPASALVPADPYRQEITTIDRLVFAPVLDARYKMMLMGNLAALAGRLDVPGPARPSGSVLQELRALAAYVKDVQPPEGQPELHRRWVDVRRNLFGQQAWFANSTADVMKWPGEGAPVREETTTAAPAHTAAPPRFELPGRWSVAEVVMDGVPSPSAEVGSIWTFDEEGLTVESGPVAGRYSFIEYIDSRGPALRVETIDGSSGGWMLYEFSANGKLVVAFHGDLSQRPEGFTAGGVPGLAPEGVEPELEPEAAAPTTTPTGTGSTDTAAAATGGTTATDGAARNAAMPDPRKERAERERLDRARRNQPVGLSPGSAGPATHYLLTLDPIL